VLVVAVVLATLVTAEVVVVEQELFIIITIFQFLQVITQFLFLVEVMDLPIPLLMLVKHLTLDLDPSQHLVEEAEDLREIQEHIQLVDQLEVLEVIRHLTMQELKVEIAIQELLHHHQQMGTAVPVVIMARELLVLVEAVLIMLDHQYPLLKQDLVEMV
tara:strand:- start:563 stop:1039 length:477 start_codon:yes stop_codon:yes gene_type:complete